MIKNKNKLEMCPQDTGAPTAPLFCQSFTKSREITLQILDKSTSKTPGANLKYAEQPAYKVK